MKKIYAFLASAMFCTVAFAADAIKVELPPQKILSSEGGRFVFGQVSDFRRDQFMLDTKTGKLWKVIYSPYKNADGTDVPGDGYAVLSQVIYEDVKGLRSAEPK